MFSIIAVHMHVHMNILISVALQAERSFNTSFPQSKNLVNQPITAHIVISISYVYMTLK